MAFQTVASVISLLLVALSQSHGVPVASITKATKAKSVNVFSRHPMGHIDPVSAALTSKIHNNAILASAYQLPYGISPYASLGGIGMGTGLSSYQSYGTVAARNPYMYGYGGGFYSPTYPGSYSQNHDSYYSNHMGFPNGYNVNSQAHYAPNNFGYAAVGGRKTNYNGVKSHLGGMKRVNGVSYSGHDGLGAYNYGTHEEHVSLPGLTKVTYTKRYPVLPAFGMYNTYGGMNGYY